MSKQLEIVKIVSEISTTLVNLPAEKIDQGLERVLGLVGEYFNVDRSHIFLFSPGGQVMGKTHEWCKAGVQPLIDKLKGLPAGAFPWTMEQLEAFQTINIPRVTDMPPQAAQEKFNFMSLGIRSVLAVPMVSVNRLLGFIGFDAIREEKAWAEDQVSLLRVVAEIIASALVRQQAEKELGEREQLQQFLVRLATDFINVPLEGLEDVIKDMLETVGKYTRVDRVYIFQHDYTRGATSNTHEWCAPGISREIENLQDIPLGHLPDVLEVLQKEGSFYVPRVAGLPGDHELRTHFEQQDIQSLIVFSLVNGGESIGFVGFDMVREERIFSGTERALLKILSEIISNTLARQQVERERIAAHQRLIAVLDSMDALVYVADIENHELLFINRYGKDIWGETVGKKCWEVIQAGQQGPCDFCTNHKLLDPAGQPTGVYNWEFLNTKNDRWYDCRDNALRWVDGRVARLEIAMDITDRKKVEESLREHRDLLQSVFESIQEGIRVMDTDLTIRHVNRVLKSWFRHGLPLEGKKCYEVFRDRVGPCEPCPALRSLQSGKMEKEEFRITTTQGEKWVEIFSYPLVQSGTGKTSGIVEFVRDITQRKKAAEELQRLNQGLEQRVRERTRELEVLNRELDAFTYSVSHDLRAPLRSIDGFSQALLEDYEGELDDQGKDFLRRVRAASQRMGELIDDLLMLSRISRQELRQEEVDLSLLVREHLEILRQGEPERRVETDVTPGIRVKGDPSLLRIALDNLLDNAWKFTGKKGGARIEFGREEQGGTGVCFIRDNGSGFDMAYVDKIFDAFQRLHSPQDYPGTGIGLSIVARIIRRHGGEIWAQAGVDRGATIYFTIGKTVKENGTPKKAIPGALPGQ